MALDLFSSGSKLHWIKNLYQRIRFGGGCCDLYSLDWYLAKKIIKPLRAFSAADKAGYPADLKSGEEWDKILKEMVWAFEYFMSDDGLDLNLTPKEYIKYAKRQQKGFELFGKYFRSLWM